MKGTMGTEEGAEALGGFIRKAVHHSIFGGWDWEEVAEVGAEELAVLVLGCIGMIMCTEAYKGVDPTEDDGSLEGEMCRLDVNVEMGSEMLAFPRHFGAKWGVHDVDELFIGTAAHVGASFVVPRDKGPLETVGAHPDESSSS